MSEFLGTPRYERLRRLGAGGMGIVYEVFDRERDERLALKLLSRVEPASIYDLKKEFRALADVQHPNVVRLHDMVSAAGQWFFTMELIAGRPFSEYVARTARPVSIELTGDETPGLSSETLADERRSPLFDEHRLRAALAQLVAGVGAIHAAGKLHRDLKPSNVLVTPEGRVVVLDFGLVQDDDRGLDIADTSLDAHLIVGTPAYMAPEQAAGRRASPATDWYAVGTMLYRALSGRLPFSGSMSEVLWKKQTQDPEPLSAIVSGLPADLEELAMALLERQPERRTDEARLRQLLALDAPATHHPRRDAAAAFVGRRAELAWLEGTLDASRRGLPQSVFIHAPSGWGKTALVQHFLRRVRQNPSAVVLSGRCYARESLPYKAFDAVIDGLSRFLARLPEPAAAELLPRNRRALTSLFPVLDRVPIMDAWESLTRLPAAPVERRERAFAALKELLGRISDQGPLVLHLDNLEFGDKDSAELLARLCSAPDPPAMLVIGSYSDDREPEGGFLEALGPVAPSLGEALRQHRRLNALSQEEARELCEQLGCEPAVAAAIAAESEGDPLLLALFARQPALAREGVAARRGLEALIGSRVSALDPAERRLLDFSCVAGAPVVIEAGAEAAGMSPERARASASDGRLRDLVQLVHHHGREALRLGHDRIAQILSERLSPDARLRIHARWAEVLAARAEVEPETLAEHFLKAGSEREARRYLTLAARKAEHSLAFDRAARLHERALELTTDDDARGQLLELLAETRLHLGQPGAAASALMAAAELAPRERSAELSRRAAALRLTDEQIDGLFARDGRGGLFDGLTRDAAQSFLRQGQLIEADAGVTVSRRGDEPPAVLVVLAGGLSVEQAEGRVSAQPGEILGTLSFLQNTARLSDVHASVDGTRVLCITRASLDELSQHQPQLALQLTVNLARILCSKLVNVHARAFGI